MLPLSRVSLRRIAQTYLLLLLVTPRLALVMGEIEVVDVSIVDSRGNLWVEVSSTEAGTFEIEVSENLENWNLYKLGLVEIPSDAGGTRGVLLVVSESGSSYFRFLPKDDSAESAELAINRLKWEALGISSYEYETNGVCYCEPELTREVRVTVIDGEVDRVRDVHSGELLDVEGYGTIEGLFDQIENALDRQADFVTVGYDPLYGYPVAADIDWSVSWVDDEYGYRGELLGYVRKMTEGDRLPVEDQFSVDGVELAGDLLRVNLSYSGGCSLHHFELEFDSESFEQSSSDQLNLYLRHNDRGDSCNSIVDEAVEFDLSAIRSLFDGEEEEPARVSLSVLSVIDGEAKEEGSLVWEFRE